MSDVSPLRRNIQIEAVRFRSAVSEDIAQKLGGSINFINDYQHSEKQFWINGMYNQLVLPFAAIDGLVLAEFDLQIIDAFMFIRQAGSSGTTELDVKYATTPGGPFTSIFSTTPKISFAAGNFSWTYLGAAFANTTAPVLGTANITAKSVLRCDILDAQGGDARGTGIVIHYRPTSL